MQILDKQDGLFVHAAPGHWNDPDMMEVGNGMSVNKDRAHFSMSAVLAAPLIAANDLRNMSSETREILTNREVIAINQDPLGIQGWRWRAEDGVEIWFRPLLDDEWAMAVLNRNPDPRPVRLDWARTRLHECHSQRGVNFGETAFSIRDLWAGEEFRTTETPLSAVVQGHDVLVVRLAKR